MSVYSVAYPNQKAHAAALKRGLRLMVPGFTAELCAVCGGEGSRSQWGPACDCCGGQGLCQGTGHPYTYQRPAPVSVTNQVLHAGGGDMVESAWRGLSYRPRKPERMR